MVDYFLLLVRYSGFNNCFVLRRSVVTV